CLNRECSRPSLPIPRPYTILYDTAPSYILFLSLHDALPIFVHAQQQMVQADARDRHHQHDDHAAGGGESAHVKQQGQRGRLAERSEEHTSELQSRENLVCRLLLEKKNIRHFYKL